MYDIELRRQAQRALDKLPKDDFGAVIGEIKKPVDSPRPRGVEKIKAPAYGASGMVITG